MPSQGHMEGVAMIVKRKDEEQKSVAIGDIPLGTVFEKDNVVYLKIVNTRLDHNVRAVSVEDGDEFIFQPDTEVIPLEAELVIWGECK